MIVDANVEMIVEEVLTRDETCWGKGGCHATIFLGKRRFSAHSKPSFAFVTSAAPDVSVL
jgi:hypothetical protein